MKTFLTIIATAIATSIVWLFVVNDPDLSVGNAGRANDAAASGEDGEPVHDAERPAAEATLDRSDTIRIDNSGDPIRIAPSVEVGPNGLAVPVSGLGTDDLVDTFTQARAGGARRHDAIDIMAPSGTPVVAAAPGVVEKIYFSEGGGGKTVYVRSKDKRWLYYYAHLKDYARGLKEGQQVRRGQRLGTVGVTGNAAPDAPHLHFAINRMEPEERWHQGRPVNPYPLLAGGGEGG